MRTPKNVLTTGHIWHPSSCYIVRQLVYTSPPCSVRYTKDSVSILDWDSDAEAHFSTIKWKQNEPVVKRWAFYFSWRLKLQEVSLQATQCSFLVSFTAYRPTWRGVKLYFQMLPTLDCLLVVWQDFMAQGLGYPHVAVSSWQNLYSPCSPNEGLLLI